MILGFVHLAQINVKEAREDFGRAIENDSTDPLSRLGMGLAIIREGKLVEGREQIEIAVALEPTNSLLRSYVGKAYYEENTKERDNLASIQFELAKQFDLNDPTPWFYGAIAKQSLNNPVEAHREFEVSIDKNDNRAVYRSRLLLDSDRAARDISLAQTYRQLGFDQIALREATSAVNEDPVNSSSHRFLAEAYEKLPRSEIARDSEYLQAQLRQPISQVPLSALRAQANPLSSFLPTSGAFDVGGPSRLAFNEFTPLFDRNGVGLFFDGLTGEKGTDLHQVAATMVYDNMAMSVAQGHFEINGFEPNRDFLQNSTSVFIQGAPSTGLNLQAQYTESHTDRGDFFFAFDPIFVVPIRLQETSRVMRIGARYELNSQSELLLSIIDQSFNADLFLPIVDFTQPIESNANGVETQYTYTSRFLNVVTGFGNTVGKLFFVGGPPAPDTSYNNAYIYAYLHDPNRQVLLELGVSNDEFETGDQALHVSCPKVGLALTPLHGTTIRFAAFRSAKRPFIASQTIEPTQVVGFNQFYDDFDGSAAWRYGIGLDQRLPYHAVAGAEATKRNIDVPSVAGTFRWRERTQRVYFYLPISKYGGSSPLAPWSWALTAEYRNESLRRPEEETGFEGIRTLDTQYIPLGITAFLGTALSIQLRSTHVEQTGRLQVDVGTDQFEVKDRFWLTDLSAMYRLPARRGTISIGARNLFDRHLTFVDPDASTPVFARGRITYARLTLRF